MNRIFYDQIIGIKLSFICLCTLGPIEWVSEQGLVVAKSPHRVSRKLNKRKLTWGDVSLYGWPPVYFVWIQLLCLFWISISFTCLAESKPVKQDVRCVVLLPPMTDALWLNCQAIVKVLNEYFSMSHLDHLRMTFLVVTLWLKRCKIF